MTNGVGVQAPSRSRRLGTTQLPTGLIRSLGIAYVGVVALLAGWGAVGNPSLQLLAVILTLPIGIFAMVLSHVGQALLLALMSGTERSSVSITSGPLWFVIVDSLLFAIVFGAAAVGTLWAVSAMARGLGSSRA
jgi:hypothetical protein